MAGTKECLVIIMDVRQNAAQELKHNTIQCAGDILKEKICSGRKDLVSFILLGAQRSQKPENFNNSTDSYTNIVHYPDFVVPSWNVLVDLIRFVSEESGNDGDWLNAVVAAVELLKNSAEVFKIKKQRIILFHDFDCPNSGYDGFCELSKDIMEFGIQLIVVSRNIQYIDNAETGKPQAVFRSSPKKPDFQLENEKYALRLISHCNAKLYNFKQAFQDIALIENKRPWVWYCDLSIGSKIRIKLSGIIYVKNANNIILNTCWGSAEERCVERVTKYYNKGEEVQLAETDLIDAYMLGTTPIPLDEPIRLSNEPIQPGLKFLGFLKQDSIPSEYYSGDSHYLLVHQKGMSSSAKMLDALVKALLKMHMCMLCWRVYSLKFNNPKIVLINPNEITDDRPASLSMIEIAYHAQHLFWNFPALHTDKNHCNNEQLEAIDNLIDSMNLGAEQKKQNSEREKMQKDLLPFEFLPNIYERTLLDMLERKVLSEEGKHHSCIQNLVAEKNYKDIFWRVPETIEEQAKQAANKVKKLFPLHKNVLQIQTKSDDKLANDKGKTTNSKDQHAEIAAEVNTGRIKCVGSTTPAEDFEQLIKHEVLTVENHTLRDVTFHSYAKQMFTIIWHLIFDPIASVDTKVHKITKALKVIRRHCYDFHAIDIYNDWIQTLRERVEKEKLDDFWSNCVVKEELGLCFVGATSIEEKEKQDAFYKIDTNYFD